MSSEFDFSFDRPVYGEELLAGTGHLARAAWLAKHVRSDDIYFMQDGTLSRLLFKEILGSFVAGQYIATIVLGFSLIERTVAGRLAHVGEKAAALATSKSLLKNAWKRNWLNEEEHALLDDLREKIRNPIVHYRDHLSDSRPEVRAVLNARAMEQVLEVDAKRVLEATIHVLHKTSI